jgi:predicted GIY-YIG superfamily endonuclease
MVWAYILRGSSGRYYIGSAVDFRQDSLNTSEGIRTSRTLGKKLEIVANKEFSILEEARQIKRILKRKKSPRVAIYLLQR